MTETEKDTTDPVETNAQTFEATILHCQPRTGDIIFLMVEENLSDQQMRNFRSQLYRIAHEHEARTGVKFTFLAVNSKLEIQHLTSSKMQEILHDNKVIVHPDGEIVETMRLVDAGPEEEP